MIPRKFSVILFSLFMISTTAFCQSSATLTIDTHAHGQTIPSDFIGESFEAGSLRNNVNGVRGHLFDSSDIEMVHLFKELGIKNLRIGGGTVDMPNINPTHADIDALFRFAKAAGVSYGCRW